MTQTSLTQIKSNSSSQTVALPAVLTETLIVFQTVKDLQHWFGLHKGLLDI